MPTETEKMFAGELHDPEDPILVNERDRARRLCRQFNTIDIDQDDERLRILFELLPNRSNDNICIEPPFHCDYGSHIYLGENVYFNVNCMILDVGKVTIGSNVMFGPSVQLLTPAHPIKAEERRTQHEQGKPISIGDDVWLGGGVIVCPGVSIGARSVIGAGSIVTKNIPEDVVAAGNPCRVIKKIEQ